MKNNVTFFALLLGQGLLGSVVSLLTLTLPLLGKQLAPVAWLMSLPLAASVLGAMAMVGYASKVMAKYGRRRGFLFSSGLGLVASLLAILAVYGRYFWLLVLAAFVFGLATVFNQYYRFAVAEIFADPIKTRRCTAFLIGSGIIGGVIGPLLAAKGQDLIMGYPFLGAFMISLCLFLAAGLVHLAIVLPHEQKMVAIHRRPPLSAMPQSVLLATFSCAIGFALMTLMMNATPLVMHQHHYDVQQSARVLQWHFIAMYAPALALPFLLEKIKITTLIQLGAICFLLGSLAIYGLPEYGGYLVCLIAVGMGWSLMFSGGTLLLNAYPDNPQQWQGVNATATYLANTLAALLAGGLLYWSAGWLVIHLLNVAVIIGFLVYSRFNL
ncbi:MFS transporter [Volucribacter amazonae]|uniref:MFS family arabinose efflux permease n=1 Tax=Volucribacter amazonae TaxID=256731 RepID=A0A9X4SLY7_9PAST|nr:MFS transporter [Volucribacter amazonae]MDG6895543.1 hypothetical protein [Volucribacter amazonae]